MKDLRNENPELSRRLNSMKSSRAISRIRCLHWTDVSRTILVIIIRDHTARDFIENPDIRRHKMKASTKRISGRDLNLIVLTPLRIVLLNITWITNQLSVPKWLP